MGNATREALAASRKSLESVESGFLTLVFGEELFAAGRIIEESMQLRSLLVDPTALPEEKRAIVDRIFSRFSAEARSLVTAIILNHWSTQDDLLNGIEEIASRAVALSADANVSIEGELFQFGSVVSSDAELELALNSPSGTQDAKLGLVKALLSGKASDQTVVIVKNLVQQPRGRRIAELLHDAQATVADQSDLLLATVTVAAPLASEQLLRLRKELTRRYGRELSLNLVIDPSVLGGLRIQIGNHVIDGSIENRVNELRLQLAG